MTKEPKKVAKTSKKSSTPAVKAPKKSPIVDDAVTDAFIMEVDEEVKNDNLRDFFKKYGLFVVLFVALVLSATVSFEKIKNWRENQFRAKTDTYIAANLAQTNQDMITALEKIALGNNGIYSELAHIQIAELLFEENKQEEALNMLQTLVDNDELNPRIRNLAAIKLASHKVDTAPFTEIESLLSPAITADDSWSPIAKDFLALSAIQNGDKEKARAIYQELLQDGRLSDETKNRVQDMLTTLSDDQ